MSKKTRYLTFVIVVILMIASYGAGAGTYALHQGYTGVGSSEPSQARPVFGIFWQAWGLVDKYYVDQKAINPKEMTYGAIEGMLDSLGDVGHTRFLSPEDLKIEQSFIAGRLEGIGAEVSLKNGQPIIVATIDGSPAQKAGLRPGDVIVRVNGQDVSRWTIEQVVTRIRGAPGTTVHLTVIHPGQYTLTEITIVRAEVKVPSVTWHVLPESKMAHIRISQFGEKASEQLLEALQAARQAGVQALIVDVRNDPGGLLDQSINAVSQFLSSGNVLLEQDRSGKRTPYPVKPGGIATAIPLAVLVNGGTASAAEIFAGAIQDNRRGVIIGEHTFGTGTVLSTFTLQDGSAILLGTSEWLTPNGKLIKGNGITPNIVVKLPSDVIPLTPGAESDMTEAQILHSSDTQLLKAIAYLREHMNP